MFEMLSMLIGIMFFIQRFLNSIEEEFELDLEFQTKSFVSQMIRAFKNNPLIMAVMIIFIALLIFVLFQFFGFVSIQIVVMGVEVNAKTVSIFIIIDFFVWFPIYLIAYVISGWLV